MTEPEKIAKIAAGMQSAYMGSVKISDDLANKFIDIAKAPSDQVLQRCQGISHREDD